MAAKSNIIVGLDIGTTTVTVAVGEVFPDSKNSVPAGAGANASGVGANGPKINIVGIGTSPSRGLRKGVVINIEATVESITQAVSQAETMSGGPISSVFAAISGSHIKGFNSHGIVGIKNKEVSNFDIERVVEAAKAVAIPLDREILHVLPQEFIIDEQDGIKDPIGISGVRLEAKVHIVTGAVASAQNVVKCANRCGLSVKDIVLASVASGKAALSSEELELGVCLLDIGGGTIDLTVFHGGAVKYTSVIAVGGNHITNDIAAGLRTPIAAAEELKCRYGAALGRIVSIDDTIDVPSTGERAPRTISRLALTEIIEPRLQEIFTLIQRELVRAGCDGLLTSGFVLTGGTANLAGIAQAAEQVFGLPVRIGSPRSLGGLTDLVGSPEYATAVGLVLYGATSSAQVVPTSKIGRLVKKVGNWFGEHF